MPKPMSQARRKLLFELEGIVGNQFYNPYIQNYRPGGVRESDGRALRYPLVFPKPDGTTMKFKDYVVPKDVPNNVLLYGHYVLGANHLNIMLALDRAIRHLEQKYGFSIEGQTTSEPES